MSNHEDAQAVLERHDPSGYLSRLQEWRDNGSAPDIAYCAGNDLFAQDVTALLAEVERLQRQRDELLSYINGIARQAAAMVEANT